jgi:hypothetical protein
MPIEYKKKLAVFSDISTVEEAEGLLEWLQNKPSTKKIDLTACTHMHPANLQVLMAQKSNIEAWPKDANLRAWLESALKLE